MPRKPDLQVEQRILQAALELCEKGREDALTMRAIARKAATNTPTVYRRFKSRRDIVLALMQKTRRDLISVLKSSRSPEETCERYLALTHPYQFGMLHTNPSASNPSPGRQVRRAKWSANSFVKLIRTQLAQRFGGSSTELLSVAVWALAHGTATLVTSGGLSNRQVREMKAAFAASVDSLTGSETLLRSDLWTRA